jgi:hypothetical protein
VERGDCANSQRIGDVNDRFDDMARAIAAGTLTRRAALGRVGLTAGIVLLGVMTGGRSAQAATTCHGTCTRGRSGALHCLYTDGFVCATDCPPTAKAGDSCTGTIQ